MRGRPRTFLKAHHRVSALPRQEVRAGGAGCQLDGRHGQNNGWRLGLPFLGPGVSSCPLRSPQGDPRSDPSDHIRHGRGGGQPRQRSEVPWRGRGSGRGRPAQPFSIAGMDSSWPLLREQEAELQGSPLHRVGLSKPGLSSVKILFISTTSGLTCCLIWSPSFHVKVKRNK